MPSRKRKGEATDLAGEAFIGMGSDRAEMEDSSQWGRDVRRLEWGRGKTMATALDLTSEELHIYQVAARRRQKQEQRKLAHREKRAWELARRAAAFLREQFGATQVVVFGSLVHEGTFTLWSDVDIAAWGIRPEDTFLAIGAVMDLDPEVQVNLVDVATCSPSLLTIIKREGMQL